VERTVRPELGKRRSRPGVILKHDVGNLAAADPAPKSTSKEPVSLKPWSDYSESDYSLEQWHAACLIHLHDSGDYTKADCKLPVKTPDGTVNKNGVFAAAAALAGARGGVQAPDSEKASAAKSLIGLYGKIGAKPPPSLTMLAHGMDVDNFLDHHGVKGQKWGIRHPRSESHSEEHTTTKALRNRPVSSLSNAELKKINERLNLEQNYKRLNPTAVERGKKKAELIMGTIGVSAAVLNTPVGRAAIAAGKTALGLGLKTGLKLITKQ
jgi:hypothetical protein